MGRGWGANASVPEACVGHVHRRAAEDGLHPVAIPRWQRACGYSSHNNAEYAIVCKGAIHHALVPLVYAATVAAVKGNTRHSISLGWLSRLVRAKML